MDKFKENDWVIYNYEIYQLVKCDYDPTHLQASNGFVRSGNPRENEMRPLTLRNKQIADGIKSYYDEMHKYQGSNALNWPDINGWLERKCLEIIDYFDANPKAEKCPIWDVVQKFSRELRDKLRNCDSVDGIRIFRN